MGNRRLIITVTVWGAEAVMAPFIPLEAAIAVVIAGASLCVFLYRREVLALARRAGRHLLPQKAKDETSFREMSNQIDRFRQSLMEDNKEPDSVNDIHMSSRTTSEWKLLVYKLNKLGINPPEGRDIVEFIDWLPYLQALAEDGRLDEARNINPYERTTGRLIYARRLGGTATGGSVSLRRPATPDDERPQ